MTSWPCSASSAAATDESTPPDIATTMRICALRALNAKAAKAAKTQRSNCSHDEFHARFANSKKRSQRDPEKRFLCVLCGLYVERRRHGLRRRFLRQAAKLL